MITRLCIVVWLLPALILTVALMILMMPVWFIHWLIVGKVAWNPADYAFFVSGGSWIMQELSGGYYGW